MVSSLGSAQPEGPIIVRLVEPARDPVGLGDVLVSALGLSGVLAVAGVLLGIGVAWLLFWLRSRVP